MKLHKKFIILMIFILTSSLFTTAYANTTYPSSTITKRISMSTNSVVRGQIVQRLKGTVSPLVLSGKAKYVSRIDPNKVLHLAIVMKPRNSASLLGLALSKQKISKQQYTADFAPSKDMVQTVTSYVKASNLQTIRQSADVILVSGKASDIEKDFNTQLNVYSFNGKKFYANSNDPLLPSNVASLVTGIVGLNEVDYTSGPIKKAVTDSGTMSQFTPDAIRTAYGLDPAYGNNIDGTGTKIAIVMSGDFNKGDVQKFSDTFGIPYDTNKIQAVQVTNTPTPSGYEGESTLDVEWAHAIAPGATITEYETGDMAGANLMKGFDSAVQANSDIISMSFGAPEDYMSTADIASWHMEFAKAVAQGSTPIAATGDYGIYLKSLFNKPLNS